AIGYDLLPATGILRSGVELHLTPAMSEKPAARIVSLVHRDPVNPGLQGALPAEAPDITEHFEEDFLNHVAGFGRVIEQAQGKRINRLLEALDQLLICLIGAFAESLHEAEIFELGACFGRPLRAQIQYRGGHWQPHMFS